MNLSKDDWVAIPGYEGVYEIHPLGKVRSLNREVIGRHGPYLIQGQEIKPIRHKDHGYYLVNLLKNGQRKQFRLHILVATVFIPNPENKPTVNHKYGDKSQNAKHQLEWATHQEQMTHAAAHGLTASGERNGGNKLSDNQVREAFGECMSGLELSEVSLRLGVNRNTLPKAFKRIGLGEQWKEEAIRRKSSASNKRWAS